MSPVDVVYVLDELKRLVWSTKNLNDIAKNSDWLANTQATADAIGLEAAEVHAANRALIKYFVLYLGQTGAMSLRDADQMVKDLGYL